MAVSKTARLGSNPSAPAIQKNNRFPQDVITIDYFKKIYYNIYVINKRKEIDKYDRKIKRIRKIKL